MKTNILTTIDAIRQVQPIGAGAIFAIAWLAGFCGSFAVLLIAGAFVVGIYLSRRVQGSNVIAADCIQAPPVVVPTMADQLRSAGLEMSKIEFRKPAPVRKASK